MPNAFPFNFMGSYHWQHPYNNAIQVHPEALVMSVSLVLSFVTSTWQNIRISVKDLHESGLPQSRPEASIRIYHSKGSNQGLLNCTPPLLHWCCQGKARWPSKISAVPLGWPVLPKKEAARRTPSSKSRPEFEDHVFQVVGKSNK